jgi:hypothetical protein
MNINVMVAIISAATSLIVAALSYYFSKKREVEAEWRKEKLQQYRYLLEALSANVEGISTPEANEHYAHAVNTIALVASQSVISALIDLRKEISYKNPNRSIEREEELLTKLMLEIRRDLRVKPKDDPTTFRFSLTGIPPKQRAV